MPTAFEESDFNIYKGSEEPDILIISSGPPALYAEEAIGFLDMWSDIGLLKLGTTYPLPFEVISSRIENAQKILFVEEVDAFLELHVRSFVAELPRSVPCFGKLENIRNKMCVQDEHPAPEHI